MLTLFPTSVSTSSALTSTSTLTLPLTLNSTLNLTPASASTSALMKTDTIHVKKVCMETMRKTSAIWLYFGEFDLSFHLDLKLKQKCICLIC